MGTIEIKGIWLIKQHEHLGNRWKVVVELPNGSFKLAIEEIADDGPVSHYVHPSGIANAPDHDLEWSTDGA